MRIQPLRADLVEYLKKRGLAPKFRKQAGLFRRNPRHPSLHTELPEPRSHRLYSFRLDQKYRIIFIYVGQDTVEVIDINPHYH